MGGDQSQARELPEEEKWLRTVNLMYSVFYPEFFCDYMDAHPLVRQCQVAGDIHDHLHARLGRSMNDAAQAEMEARDVKLLEELNCENNMPLSPATLDQACGVFYGTADYKWVRLIARIAREEVPGVSPSVRSAADWSLNSHIDEGLIDVSTLGAPAAAPRDAPRLVEF